MTGSMATFFDTQDIVDKLEAGGFTHAQARAQTEILKELVGVTNDRLATKTDLESASKGLQADFKAGISDAKSELVRWVVGVGMLQSALITALLLKLVH